MAETRNGYRRCLMTCRSILSTPGTTSRLMSSAVAWLQVFQSLFIPACHGRTCCWKCAARCVGYNLRGLPQGLIRGMVDHRMEFSASLQIPETSRGEEPASATHWAPHRSRQSVSCIERLFVADAHIMVRHSICVNSKLRMTDSIAGPLFKNGTIDERPGCGTNERPQYSTETLLHPISVFAICSHY